MRKIAGPSPEKDSGKKIGKLKREGNGKRRRQEICERQCLAGGGAEVARRTNVMAQKLSRRYDIQKRH